MREVQVTLAELGLLVGTRVALGCYLMATVLAARPGIRGRGPADHAAERGYVFVAWR